MKSSKYKKVNYTVPEKELITIPEYDDKNDSIMNLKRRQKQYVDPDLWLKDINRRNE